MKTADSAILGTPEGSGWADTVGRRHSLWREPRRTQLEEYTWTISAFCFTSVVTFLAKAQERVAVRQWWHML